MRIVDEEMESDISGGMTMLNRMIAKIERQITRLEKELLRYQALEDSGKINAEGRRMFAYYNGKIAGYESALSLITAAYHEVPIEDK